jgi:uncharacterized protein (TIGR02099 family)
MHALPPVPSTLLKLASAVARWSLVLMLSAWFILAAMWCALHWIIVPRIGDFRADVETRVSAALGVPVKIGAITARSGGLIPSIEFSDVKLMDAQGQEALALSRVVAAISPQSAMRFGLDQLYIDGPQLDVRRRLDGRFVVAGVVLADPDNKDEGRVADWLFSQREVVIKNGVVRWIDEKHPQTVQSPMVVRQVDFLLRNGFRSHDLRLDGTPDALLGDRFTVVGRFRQPLLSRHNGYWQDWSGQLYALFDRVDVARLSDQVGAGVQLGQGRGALRTWVDVQNGKVTRAVADVALLDVNTKLGGQSNAPALLAVTGRLGGRLKDDGFEFQTEGLAVQAEAGKPWPGGNFKIEKTGAKYQLEVDKLDLALLAQLADHLPISDTVRARLATVAPKGLVDNLRANWTGALDAPEKFDIQGKVKALALSSSGPRIPGVSGLSANFSVNEAGGKASLDVANGAIDLPGFFEESRVVLTELKADVEWKIAGQNISLQTSGLAFKNQDAQGTGQVKWQSSQPNPSQGRGRFPGVLDLQATLSRFDGASVHRYLPLSILPGVRDYVRQAVRKGQASSVKFQVKGDLFDLPFRPGKPGEFRVSANFSDVNFAFVPKSIAPEGALPWPELTQMKGEFLLDRLQLQVKNASGQLAARPGMPALQITKADAQIPDLLNSPTVSVSGEAKGPLSSMLAVVNDSPLRGLTGAALAETTATGPGDVRLKLNLPLGALESTTVQGSVTLTDSDVRMSAAAPLISRANGGVNFNEKGFNLPNLQGRMYGGEVAIKGGSANFNRPEVSAGAAAPADTGRLLDGVVLQARGKLSAQALRQATELGLVSRLALQATGSSDYMAEVTFGRGMPELVVTTNLAGMALSLPQPFAKPAETSVPVRIQITNRPDNPGAVAKTPARLVDQILIDIPKVAAFNFVRDVSSETAKVLSGSIGVGLGANEFAPMPVEGVVANINLPTLDLDAWARVFSQASGTPTNAAAPAGLPSQGVESVANASDLALAYLPSVVALRTGELAVAGRKFSKVVLGASREGRTWRGNMDSTELNGYAEYRQATGASAGRVFARLARLTLAQSSAKEVETLLDEQPASVPALDIVVDDLELRGKKLGRVELEAINRVSGAAREWRLAKFNILTPEATFTATGNWATLSAQAQGAPANPAKPGSERRRTVMNFKLDVADSGELLSRFGMKDVIRQGKGKLEGEVAWVGSPLFLDYPTLGGAFTVNMESGQFLKADPGIAKLLGVLSLQSLPRRLALDFRDVFTEGFSFDFVRGDIKIEQGIATTNNLQMKGVNAAVLMEGRADIARETQDLRVVVVPEINAGTASLIAGVINPAIGLGTFLAQLILRRPLIETATQEFHVDGTWLDPRVTRVTRKSDGTLETPAEVAR